MQVASALPQARGVARVINTVLQPGDRTERDGLGCFDGFVWPAPSRPDNVAVRGTLSGRHITATSFRDY